MFVVGKTDIGKVRKENQDKVHVKLIDDDVALAVVCDGMGGMELGGVAGEIAANAVFDRLSISYRPEMENNSIRNLLITSVSAANSIIYRKSVDEDKVDQMGTTCVGAIVRKNTAYVASVGDSRAYIIDDDGIRQITNDHNVAQMLMREGKLDVQAAMKHKFGNMVTRALGIEESVDVDYFEEELKPHSVVLICTDGLSSFCTDEIMFSYIYRKPLETAAAELISYVNSHGGRDNVTVTLISN